MIQRRGALSFKAKAIQQITVDPQFHCLYVQISSEKIVKTIEHNPFEGLPAAHIDLDKEGNIVGVEIVGFKKANINKQLFIELAKVYNRPELRKIPTELKHDLAIV